MGYILHVAILDVDSCFFEKALDDQIESFKKQIQAVNDKFSLLDSQRVQTDQEQLKNIVQNCAEDFDLDFNLKCKDFYKNSRYIIAGPEFMFINKDSQNLDPKIAHGSYTKADKIKMRNAILEFSKNFPKLFIAAGTIPYLKQSEELEYKNTLFFIHEGKYVSYSKRIESETEQSPKEAQFIAGKKPGLFFFDPFFISAEICAEVEVKTLQNDIMQLKQSSPSSNFLDLQMIFSDPRNHTNPLNITNDGILIHADTQGYSMSSYYNNNMGGVFNKWGQPVGNRSKGLCEETEIYFFTDIYLVSHYKPNLILESDLMPSFLKNEESSTLKSNLKSLFFKNNDPSAEKINIQAIAPEKIMTQNEEEKKLKRRIAQHFEKVHLFLQATNVTQSTYNNIALLYNQNDLVLYFAPEELALLLTHIELDKEMIEVMKMRGNPQEFNSMYNLIWVHVFRHLKTTEKGACIIEKIADELIDKGYLVIHTVRDIIDLLELVSCDKQEKLLRINAHRVNHGTDFRDLVVECDEKIRDDVVIAFFMHHPDKITGIQDIECLIALVTPGQRNEILSRENVITVVKESPGSEAARLAEYLPEEKREAFLENFPQVAVNQL